MLLETTTTKGSGKVCMNVCLCVSLTDCLSMCLSVKAIIKSDWTTQLVVLPEGVGDQCVVMSCLRTLQVNLKSAMDLEQEGGTVLNGVPLHGLNLESDGKRRILLNRWCLYTVGTHTSRYDKIRKQLRHSFRPFCYVLMKNETTWSIETAITSLEATAKYLWGEDCNLKFYAGGGDKAGVSECVCVCVPVKLLTGCLWVPGIAKSIEKQRAANLELLASRFPSHYQKKKWIDALQGKI